MTKSSKICNLIQSKPVSWQAVCEEKKIKIKTDKYLAIFNYEVNADFSDLIVQEARGIIIDTLFCDVVCWPFRKFGNFSESYADSIDWDSASVQEKVDGSIIKLWYNKEKDEWQWSSNSCIDANDAVLMSGITLMDVIRATKEYMYLVSNLDKLLDKNNTYIFELVSPYNQVVIRYDEPKLYHIGTRNNKTGIEYSNVDIGIDKPKSYPLHSLEDCINAAKALNKEGGCEYEGFVVVDKNFHRVKVKSPEYIVYHHACTGNSLTKENAWELLHSDDFNMDSFLSTVPTLIGQLMKHYEASFEHWRVRATLDIVEARKLSEAGKTRKEIALSVKDSQVRNFVFKSLDEPQLSPEDVVKKYEKGLLKLVPDLSGVIKNLEEMRREKHE